MLRNLLRYLDTVFNTAFFCAQRAVLVGGALLTIWNGAALASAVPVAGTGSTAGISTVVTISTDGNGNYVIKVGPTKGGVGNPTAITVTLPQLAMGNVPSFNNTSNGKITAANGQYTFTFNNTGGSNIAPGKFTVKTTPGTALSPISGAAIIKVTYSNGQTISASDSSYEDPTAPPKKNQLSVANSTSDSLSFDASAGLLTITDGVITNTSIGSDPIVGAAVNLGAYSMLGLTPDNLYIAFEAVTNDIFSVDGTSGSLLQASAPFLFYSITNNEFSTMLNQVGLAGVDPTSPFFDPVLSAPSTPWLLYLNSVLNPTNATFVPDPALGISFTPDQNFYAATADFTVSGTSDATNAIFLVTPEPSSLAMGFIGVFIGVLVAHWIRSRAARTAA